MFRSRAPAFISRSFTVLAIASLVLACSSSSDKASTTPTDGGSTIDASTTTDAGEQTTDSGPMDAGPSPRTCAPATNVPDPLVISGTITQNPGTGAVPASGATVEIHSNADESVLAMATTAADGTYTLPGIPTGGKPLLAHAHITQTGLVPTILFVVDGLFTKSISTNVLAASVHDSAAKTAGVTWDHSNGIVNVSLRSCANGMTSAGLGGATITIDPGSTTIYGDMNGNPAAGGAATIAPSGNAFDFNVPAGHPAVNVVYMGRFTSTNVEAVAGSFTTIIDFP
jgi:hypothetical protein